MDEFSARRLLGVPIAWSGPGPDEVESRFRAVARRTHPDVGGDPDQFREVVEARRVLLAAVARRQGLGLQPAPVTIVPDARVVREAVEAVVRRLVDRGHRPRRVI